MIYQMETSHKVIVSLRVAPPLFFHVFQSYPQTKSDSIEIFTTDRASKMIELISEEMFSKERFQDFL